MVSGLKYDPPKPWGGHSKSLCYFPVSRFGLGDCKGIVHLPRTAQFAVGLPRALIRALYGCFSATVTWEADPAQSWVLCKVLNVLVRAGLVTPHRPCRSRSEMSLLNALGRGFHKLEAFISWSQLSSYFPKQEHRY